MKILLLEAFFSGSHRLWAEGYARYSGHEIKILSLPGRHWKWRMHGGALSLAKKFRDLDFKPDLILATDMMDLPVFIALCRQALQSVPVVLYFHENQLTYPWSPQDQDTRLSRDNHYAFINYSSALAADAVFFNSEYHRSSFLSALPAFLRQFPDHREPDLIAAVEEKSQVLPLGMDLRKFDPFAGVKKRSPALILWNHRWEYDKNPELFFEMMFRLRKEGLDYELVVLGDAYSKSPPIFEKARGELNDHIIQMGYASRFSEYARWLWQADILPVTSNQDFFGGSVVEAIYCHCFPILPDRLAYPEHIDPAKKALCFYQSDEQLYTKLKQAVTEIATIRNQQPVSDFAARYDWSILAARYDQLFDQLAN